MTVTAFAGQYGPEAILGSTGLLAISTPVTVDIHGAGAATLYTDQTMGTTSTNPVNTDTFGNLVFFATPGLYDLSFTVGGVPSTLTVEVLPWFGDVPGRLLARTQYNPSSSVVYTTSSGTLAAVDDTNLSVTFVAPASGDVEFSFEAFCQPAPSGGQLYASIWDVTANAILGSAQAALVGYNNNTADTGHRARYTQIVTGLTPGTSYHWAPAYSELGGASSFAIGQTSPFYGPALVEVRAA